MSQSRGWCFTLNNWSDEEFASVSEWNVDYAIVGKEIAPETSTPHLQGYLYHKSKKTLKQVKALLPRAHWENAHGSVEQKYDYCTKAGLFTEYGSKPLSQKEKGLKGAEKISAMWALAKAGEFESLPPASIKTWEYIHVKYAAAPSDRSELDNIWIVGKSGCGKSRHVRETYPQFYNKGMSKWWDGYSNEDVVLLDDFSPTHGKYLSDYLKVWADHYSFNAEVKGGMLKIRPKTVVITSQYELYDCFEEQETIEAIRRRFKVIRM